MKNSSYYIAPVGVQTHDLPHTVASYMGKVSYALTHSATAAVNLSFQHFNHTVFLSKPPMAGFKWVWCVFKMTPHIFVATSLVRLKAIVFESGVQQQQRCVANVTRVYWLAYWFSRCSGHTGIRVSQSRHKQYTIEPSPRTRFQQCVPPELWLFMLFIYISTKL